MGIITRIKSLFSMKAERVLDRLEDPTESLNYAYNQKLKDIEEGQKQVIQTRSKIKIEERKIKPIEDEIEKLNILAVRHLEASSQSLSEGDQEAADNSEQEAQSVVTRKVARENELSLINEGIVKMKGALDKLENTLSSMKADAEDFKHEKEAITISYEAEKIRTQALESNDKIGISDNSKLVNRAIEKAVMLESYNEALEETAGLSGGPNIDEQLRQLDRGDEVSRQMAELRKQLGSGSLQHKELPSGE